MNCSECRELLAEYRDLDIHHEDRLSVDEHIRECELCGEEFRKWQNSLQLLSLATREGDKDRYARISQGVMNRIYAEEAWRMPLADRSYRFNLRQRRKLALTLGFFLTLFLSSFLLSVLDNGSGTAGDITASGFVPVLKADGVSGSDPLDSLEGIPVASVSEPVLIAMSPLQNDPNYWVILSLLGVIAALLTLNWLSRVRV